MFQLCIFGLMWLGPVCSAFLVLFSNTEAAADVPRIPSCSSQQKSLLFLILLD